MLRKIVGMIVCFSMIFTLVGCSGKENSEAKVTDADFEEIVKTAEGTTVNFYGYGGDEVMNKWFDSYVIPQMKEKYNITVKRTGMNIDEIMNMMLSDKQAGNTEGNIDVVWINGENFKTAKESNLLLGSFTDKLPSYNNYVNTESEDVTTDFGVSTDGMEAPWGKSQFTVVYDSNRKSRNITDSESLKDFVKSNPGKFTYPVVSDFTGSAFVRNIIYDIVGYEKVSSLPEDKEKVKEAIQPAIDYLNEIKSYLWNEGKTYPADLSQLDNMYSDGEVDATMTYNCNSIRGKIDTGEFRDSSKITEFKNGNITNVHFLSMPFNTQNQEGAMVLIDFLMSPEAQASKTFTENWGDATVLDMDKLSDTEKKEFSSDSVVIEKSVPEPSAGMVSIIEEIWTDEVLNAK